MLLELIAQLQELADKHGNLKVAALEIDLNNDVCFEDGDYTPIDSTEIGWKRADELVQVDDGVVQIGKYSSYEHPAYHGYRDLTPACDV